MRIELGNSGEGVRALNLEKRGQAKENFLTDGMSKYYIVYIGT